MASDAVYLKPVYEEQITVHHEPVPMTMVTDRIGIARDEWQIFIVIDGQCMVQVGTKNAKTQSATAFIRQAIKEWNRLAEIERERLIDKTQARTPIEGWE